MLPRRCPRHPDQVTSSDDGVFDAPCGACEFEMEEHYGANDPEFLSLLELEPQDDNMGYDTLEERDMDRETDEDVPF